MAWNIEKPLDIRMSENQSILMTRYNTIPLAQMSTVKDMLAGLRQGCLAMLE